MSLREHKNAIKRFLAILLGSRVISSYFDSTICVAPVIMYACDHPMSLYAARSRPYYASTLLMSYSNCLTILQNMVSAFTSPNGMYLNCIETEISYYC